MKYVFVGKHNPSNIQLGMLKEAGLVDMVKRFKKVDDVKSVVDYAGDNECAIVVQGLPIGMMAELVTLARKANVPVYIFRTRLVFSMKNGNKCPEWCDVVVKRGDIVECKITESLQRIKKVVFDSEDVVKAKRLTLTAHVPHA